MFFLSKIKRSFRKVRNDVSLLIQNQYRLRQRIENLEKRVKYLELERIKNL